MSIHLVKFGPLASTKEGQAASARFNIPPYVDGSCRREPDFESRFPSISALCRAELFVPRLEVGDDVVYITLKSEYGTAFRHWRIVARLKVFKRFESHPDAASWYRGEGMSLPSNCMVPGNEPMALERTSRGQSACAPGCGSPTASLKEWNDRYQDRANRIPVFFVCKTVWMNLTDPSILTDSAAIRILKTWERVNSRRPIKITPAELTHLEHVIASQIKNGVSK
jgi:hypothetical protein